jgi:hypothetical protein
VINVTYAYFNVSGNEYLENCTLKFNGLQTIMTRSNDSNFYHHIMGLADGQYVFNATCNDSAGNSNITETRNFSVDTAIPALTFVSPTPTNNAVVKVNYTVINVTLSEPLIAVYINWNGTVQLMNSSSPTNWYINETNLSNGNYQYWTFGTDPAGNMGWSEVRNVTIRERRIRSDITDLLIVEANKIKPQLKDILLYFCMFLSILFVYLVVIHTATVNQTKPLNTRGE